MQKLSSWLLGVGARLEASAECCQASPHASEGPTRVLRDRLLHRSVPWNQRSSMVGLGVGTDCSCDGPHPHRWRDC